ncbi:tRNA guanosine(34) transglycosylase Tgt [Candidatus Uhrbacteria bacterium CG10_big_fil_rev_8_21_14_0_10_50_16]|uniref:Queuine tRNA-ribosyltransferase n=1 Tax=Candidatus Uhrbacteria bacterium CG10_big_fil_rev_8_21_14_0_10_50_16 TaxID=1975039 RepID=A0A2H0RMW2_9BACT|nr:MAG: tRNA guanosine(34) transglycosylase Tgt [Candidatus Uhrbacteria bacterium CG10_big_fil_rev_8_21_14_0_10_50_16]
MFTRIKQSTISKARRGELATTHGTLQTPFFMTIATKGAVRAMNVRDLKRIHVPIVLANTYHLLVRPGMDALRERGGLHKWMHWDGPMLTDSGGYQVFSLGHRRKVTEEGVTFRSHIDGSKISLTPEESIAMQQAIGSDMIMQLDVVEPPTVSDKRRAYAMERSIRWAKRCKDYLYAHRDQSVTADQKLFGIVQGGVDEALRTRSVAGLTALDLDGYAIGGLSVGESKEDNLRIAAFTASLLPQDKVRYFMGGGMPEEIVAYVRMGIDMFDCVIPTRHARHGSLFVWNGNPTPELIASGDFYTKINIVNAEYRNSDDPIDSWNNCDASQAYTRGYLRHLFGLKEALGTQLATEHNVRFYMQLMEVIRQGIEEGVL